jgi:hypothetical protein
VDAGLINASSASIKTGSAGAYPCSTPLTVLNRKFLRRNYVLFYSYSDRRKWVARLIVIG